MVSLTRKHIKLTFVILCCISTAFISGYWLVKYEFEDQSITLVDYVSLKDNEEIEQPVISLCFETPFLDQKLKDISRNVTKMSYNGYLWGIEFEDEYKKIEYHDVTFNLSEYFTYGDQRKFNKTWIDSDDMLSSIDLLTSFEGFYDFIFIKCFAMTIENLKNNYIKEIYIEYDMKSLIGDWKGDLENKHNDVFFGTFYTTRDNFYVRLIR